MYAEICLPILLNKTFTYKVPRHLIQSIKDGSCVTVSFNNKKCNGFVVSLSNKKLFNGKLNSIISINDNTDIPSELWKTLLWISNYYISPIGKVTQLALSWAFKKSNNSIRSIIGLSLNTKEFPISYFKSNIGQFSEKQKLLIQELINHHPNFVPLSKLKQNIPSIYNIYKNSIFKNLLIEKNIVSNIKEAPKIEDLNLIKLTPKQKVVYDNILNCFRQSNKPNVLHGVTGSGKTEIYLKIANHVYKKKKSCIILVPEIMLSSQIYKRFYQYFGSKVLLWHSQTTSKTKNDIWSKINKDNPYIVIGARSAIFAPVRNIGLIIVDEEHDASYKETERQPCYNARDISIIRSKFSKCMVILGSATPSLETYFNSISNKYNYHQINERYGNSVIPEVDLINLKKDNIDYNMPHLNQLTIEAINSTIDKGGQVLILHNRRGYSAIKICGKSDKVIKCEQCDIILTYHASKNKLLCHSCSKSYEYESLNFKKDVKYLGYGTENIHYYLQEQFPNLSILRMDADSANSINKQNKILNKFINDKSDILLGTQMIAKGLDIQNIQLVIVLNADIGMMIPDFKSHEKIFQMIYQVIGRAGRQNTESKALIQTFDPNHYVIKMATNNELKKFYNIQLNNRKSLNYPPFSRLIKILFQSTNERDCNKYSKMIYDIFKKDFQNYMIGPLPCPIEKLSKNYRYQIIIKTPLNLINNTIKKINQLVKIKKYIKIQKSIKILIDVDAISVL